MAEYKTHTDILASYLGLSQFFQCCTQKNVHATLKKTEYKTHTDILSRTEIINVVISMNMIIKIPKAQYITNTMFVLL